MGIRFPIGELGDHGRHLTSLFSAETIWRPICTLSGMILVISPLVKTTELAHALQEETHEPVEICAAMGTAIPLVQAKEYSAVVLDEVLLDAEPEEGEGVLKHLRAGVPVYLNLAVSSARRVCREVRAALRRREQDIRAARKIAEQAVQHQLKENATALLLTCQTALEEGMPEAAVIKIQEIEVLARKLGQELGTPA